MFHYFGVVVMYYFGLFCAALVLVVVVLGYHAQLHVHCCVSCWEVGRWGSPSLCGDGSQWHQQQAYETYVHYCYSVSGCFI